MNYFKLQILPTVDTDITIEISTGSNKAAADNDIYKLIKMEINYSIIQSSVPGFIVLGINLNEFGDSNRPIKGGQAINIYAIADGGTALQLIYAGYIRRIRTIQSIKGSFIILYIDQLLGQLTQLSANTSWDAAINRYNTIMVNSSGSKVNLIPFLNAVVQGGLITKIPNYNTLNPFISWFTFIDGSAPPLPESLWAVVQLNKRRDSVVREILFPYNRLLWQNPSGEYIIQPLFYDDKAHSKWNVDLFANSKHTWLDWEVSDNAGDMISRIDFQFAAILPFDQYGSPNYTDNNTYISSSPSTTYYPRMNSLRQSGIYDTSILTSKALDSSVISDPALMNSIVMTLGADKISNLLQQNSVYSSPIPTNSNTVPAIYASNEMALNDMKAYTFSVTYDYNVMTDALPNIPASKFLDIPLAKIVDFNSKGILEYDSMLCCAAKLSFADNAGANVVLDFTPIESILGTWYYAESN